MLDKPADCRSASSPWRRWAPLAALALLALAAYWLELHRYLSFTEIIRHHAHFKALVDEHIWTSLLAFGLIYVTVVALSFPGAALLSVLGGLYFGWMISAPVTVLAATIGATIVYSVVKTSLGTAVAERAGPLVRRLSGGFSRDAFHYLLFLRLVPAFPFFAVNAVAGLCCVRLKPFLFATVIGIIPASLVFAYLGSGLDSVIDAQIEANRRCMEALKAEGCRFEIDPGGLITPQILIAFGALGLVALLPLIVKRLRGA